MRAVDPTEAAVAAHNAALDAQSRMAQLAHIRDDAIRLALESGASATHLAEQLGITRQRVYAMARNAQNHE